MVKIFYRLSSYMVLVGALVLASCGDSGLRILGSAQNRAGVLAAQHEAIVNTYGGVYEDTRPASYGQAVLDRVMVAILSGQDQSLDVESWRLVLLDNDGVDAFSLTDGNKGVIYMTRGLLVLINDEAQLATLLAHEVAHIALGHTRYHRTRDASARHRRYSHAQERKADAAGLDYIVRAGYQPSSHTQILSALEKYDGFINEESGANVAWLAAHPLTPKRARLVAQIAKIHSDNGNKTKRFVRSQKRYLNAIDGLVFSNAVARGFYIKKRRFVHLELGMQFEVPQGFVFAESATRIVARHSNGLELVFDVVERQEGQSPDDYLRENWAKHLAGVQVRVFSIDAHAAANGQVREAERHAQLLVVSHKNQTPDQPQNKWVRFALFSPPHLSGQAQSAINAVQRSIGFGAIRVGAADAEKTRTNRLRIILVQKGDSVSRLAQRMNYDGDKAELFRILNGLRKGGILRAARSVKLID
ncbi:MAG: M48 family metalloprotease [Alphaproteobacteria bacterium]|nr:M48 family metalloprotease [Alphaproteobacteria bacterium]